jgi:hypothetical protein
MQRISEEFLDPAAAQANDVRMFLLESCLVVVLVAGVMHQIELIHQPAHLEQFERPVNRYAVQLRIFRFGELVQRLGIQVLPGLINQIQEDLALPRQADASLP